MPVINVIVLNLGGPKLYIQLPPVCTLGSLAATVARTRSPQGRYRAALRVLCEDTVVTCTLGAATLGHHKLIANIARGSSEQMFAPLRTERLSATGPCHCWRSAHIPSSGDQRTVLGRTVSAPVSSVWPAALHQITVGCAPARSISTAPAPT